MSKQQRVPGTSSSPKPNREQRRHPEKRADPAADQSLARDVPQQDDLVDQDVPPSTKVTADKWNQ